MYRGFKLVTLVSVDASGLDASVSRVSQYHGAVRCHVTVAVSECHMSQCHDMLCHRISHRVTSSVRGTVVTVTETHSVKEHDIGPERPVLYSMQ